MGVFNIHAEKKRSFERRRSYAHAPKKTAKRIFFPNTDLFEEQEEEDLSFSPLATTREAARTNYRETTALFVSFCTRRGLSATTRQKLFEKRVFQRVRGARAKKNFYVWGPLSRVSSFLCLIFFRFSLFSLAQKNILSLCVVFLFFFSSAFRVSHAESIDLRLKTHYFFLLRGRKRERERERGRRSIYTHIYIYMFLFFFFDRLMTTIKRRPLVLSAQKTVHLVREIFRNGCYDWFSF